MAQPKEEDHRAVSEGEETLLLLQQTSLLEQTTKQDDEAILSYQTTPLLTNKVKSKVDVDEEKKQILCRAWIGDDETSDYSSQSSNAEKGEVFPLPLTLEEKALLKLEEVLVPLELEAAEAITAVKMGEGISRLEEVSQLPPIYRMFLTVPAQKILIASQ